MASRANDHYASLILVIGTAFFVRSAYTLLTLPDRSTASSTSSNGNSTSSTVSSASSSSPAPKSRLVSQSAVSNVTYTADIGDCTTDNTSQGYGTRPKLKAGALLKLIDIAAGVAARRHAGTSCVTISVDSVLCESSRGHECSRSVSYADALLAHVLL
jgi:hypothetical protein